MLVKQKKILLLRVIFFIISKGAFLFMASTSLFLFAILSGVYYDQAMSLLYSLISSLLFGIYLIYDTQLIIGGSVLKNFYCFRLINSR